MLKRPVIFAVITLLAALLLYVYIDREMGAGSETASVGQLVENAVFTDFEGNTVTLDQFEGKLVLLDFWETWCVPCLRSFPGLAELQNEQPDRFVVLAVSPGMSDEEADVRAFIEEFPEYPFVWVKGYDLADALQMEGIPYKVFVGPDGTYIKSELGSRGPALDKAKIVELLAEVF